MPRNMDMSNFGEIKKPPLCKGRWVAKQLGGVAIEENAPIPQSTSLTAPFTQGSHKGAFE